MNGLIAFLILSFLLQVVTNIVLIVLMKRFIKLSKNNSVNLSNIFEVTKDEHI